MSHDVASPSMPTNTEFTTWPKDDEEMPSRYNDTLFKLMIEEAHDGQQWMTKSGYFQLMHVATKSYMWSHTDPLLPEWGFKQQEINGNKNGRDKTTIWFVDDVIKDPSKFCSIQLLRTFERMGHRRHGLRSTTSQSSQESQVDEFL